MVKKETIQKNVKYICSEIEHIIKTFGKRDPGSEGERKAQEYMKSELDKYSDSSVLEDFKINPGSFFGWIPFTASCIILGFILSFFVPVLTVVLILAGLAPMLTQFVLYKKTFDPLFKEKTSCNVMAVKKPQGEVKRRIVFGGHADATWEWTINYKFGGVGFAVEFLMSIVGAVYLLFVGIYGIAAGSAMPAALPWITVIFLPFWIALYFFSNTKMVVDGANDNLTACLASMAILKAMKEDGINLENTEVCAFLSGSEESGLRGAKAWAEAHKNDYNDVETIFVPLETLREIDHLTIYSKDLNGLVKTDPQVCKLLKIAGEKAGFDLKYGTVTVGSTDAAAFTQAGLKAACLAALDHNLRDYYHTRRDTYDNMSEECLKASLEICFETIKEFDANGLPQA